MSVKEEPASRTCSRILLLSSSFWRFVAGQSLDKAQAKMCSGQYQSLNVSASFND